jgi:hypothetical protein
VLSCKYIKTSETTFKAEESLGMVMTFSLVSNLKENLDALIRDRIEAAKRKERETERQALLEEEMRLKGTLVTKESFVRWRHDFLKAYKTEQERKDDNKMKGLGQKEREEIKRVALRHTGVYISVYPDSAANNIPKFRSPTF